MVEILLMEFKGLKPLKFGALGIAGVLAVEILLMEFKGLKLIQTLGLFGIPETRRNPSNGV